MSSARFVCTLTATYAGELANTKGFASLSHVLIDNTWLYYIVGYNIYDGQSGVALHNGVNVASLTLILKVLYFLEISLQ